MVMMGMNGRQRGILLKESFFDFGEFLLIFRSINENLNRLPQGTGGLNRIAPIPVYVNRALCYRIEDKKEATDYVILLNDARNGVVRDQMFDLLHLTLRGGCGTR